MLHLDSPLKEEELVKKLKEKGYELRGLNEFRPPRAPGEKATLVLGFGSLKMDEIEKSVKALKEDIASLEAKS